jgi:hypothetical protein
MTNHRKTTAMWDVLLFSYLLGGLIEVQVSREVVYQHDDDGNDTEDVAFTEFHLYFVCHGALARVLRASEAKSEEELVFQWAIGVKSPPWKLPWHVFLSAYLVFTALCAACAALAVKYIQQSKYIQSRLLKNNNQSTFD